MVNSDWQIEWCRRCEKSGLVDYSFMERVTGIEEVLTHLLEWVALIMLKVNRSKS